MKIFRVVIILVWLSMSNGKADGHVVPIIKDSELIFKTDTGNLELHINNEVKSWLQYVLVFSRELSGSAANDNHKACNETTKQCQTGFVLLGDQCYSFSNTTATWHEALQHCRNFSTELAHPMNSQENDFLANYIRKHFNGTVGWYLGASDEVKEGDWVWAHNKIPLLFTDWTKYQPDNGGGVEHCAHFWKSFDWKWNDTSCKSRLRFICQQQSSQTTQ